MAAEPVSSLAKSYFCQGSTEPTFSVTWKSSENTVSDTQQQEPSTRCKQCPLGHALNVRLNVIPITLFLLSKNRATALESRIANRIPLTQVLIRFPDWMLPRFVRIIRSRNHNTAASIGTVNNALLYTFVANLPLV